MYVQGGPNVFKISAKKTFIFRTNTCAIGIFKKKLYNPFIIKTKTIPIFEKKSLQTVHIYGK